MSEPENAQQDPSVQEPERDLPSHSVQARPSDDDGPHAGPSLDLPMSSPD
jgi:hypothetical protein